MDTTLPAEVRVVVRDKLSGQPVPAAHVRILERWPMWPSRPPGFPLATGPDGTVQLSEPRPAGAVELTWSGTVQVEAEGYFSVELPLQFFPGARLEQTVELEPVRTTRLQLRGPNQEPLRRIPLGITYIKNRVRIFDHGDPALLFTDDQGECLWQHPSLPEGFHLVGRPEDEILSDQPVVTVHYNADEIPRATPLLRGRLLRADGSPAEGWHVARKARFVYSSGIFSGVIVESMMVRMIRVEQLASIGPDGIFEVDAEQFLVLVSPEGIPMLYHLTPETWETEVREITLRVPETREMNHGEFLDGEGRPLAGVPLRVREIHSEGFRWEIISGGQPWLKRMPLAGTRTDGGTVIPGFQTDSQGRYSVPTYYGTTLEFQDNYEGWDLQNSWRGNHRQSILQPGRKTGHGPLKDLVLVFEDEQGAPVSELQSTSFFPFRNGKQVSSFLKSARDTRHRHLFVEKEIDQIELHFRFNLRGAKEFKQIVDVSGSEDRTVRVTIPQDQCPLPLDGTLLDPEGRPLKRTRILLYDPSLKKTGNEYFSVDHVTDDEGCFRFEIAPDNCWLAVLPAHGTERQGLPGWLPVTKVNRMTRRITGRLNRGGSVRILLPPQIGHRADGLFLERQDEEPNAPPSRRLVYFVPGQSAGELRSRIIPPGRYQLGNYQPENKDVFANLESIHAEVRADEVSVIDLRERMLPPGDASLSLSSRWSTVTVKQDDKPVSGAEVTVLSRIASEVDLSRWLSEATGRNHSPDIRAAALEMLQQTGAQAIDAIRASQSIRDKKTLLREFRYVESDGWKPVLRDLSDDRGQVRCQMDSGVAGIAIARVRGRLIGWQEFFAGDESVIIPLCPARTLIVERSEVRVDDRSPHDNVEFRMDHSREPGLRALMSLLSQRVSPNLESAGWINHIEVFEGRYAMPQDRPGRWILEDLPVGADCTVILTNDAPERSHPLQKTERVTIEPGSGAQQLRVRSSE